MTRLTKEMRDPECYAMERYVTTGELGILARGRQLTIEDYVEEFKNAYEI